MGEDYYFITEQLFKERIANESFAEWEEVYKGNFYGTLKSEIESIWKSGKEVLFDVDVKGAINLKKQYGDDALTIFIKPPSEAVLLHRLQNRATESPEKVEERINKARYELQFESYFDEVVINDSLPDALKQTEAIVDRFLFKR
jgi:guanylate kinase